ncbi:MAG: DUF1425 domain-containing protein [Thiopseudomonas sp.]|nr:DUF1425 domain-containing protein [Thiopseudomonas sp.]
MKVNTLLGAVALTALLAGCSTPSSLHIRDGAVTETSTYPKYVQDIRYKTNDNGMLEAQIVFMSSSSRTINYKVEWLGQDGFALRNPIDERYRALRLTRNEEYVLQKLASDKRARDLKVYIK